MSGSSFLRSVGFAIASAAPLACGPSLDGQAAPVPALADSGSAQRAFRALRERWHTTSVEQRAGLVQELRRFLSTYPEDHQVRLARVYLAWLLVEAGELAEARELVELTRRGPVGAAADFAQVVDAALLVRHKQPHEALKLLRPLQGKLIDPVEAFLATQQLVLSAMAANLYAEALSHVVDWSLQASPTDRLRVHSDAKSLVARVPRRYLERALETERPEVGDDDAPLHASEKQWFYDVITTQVGAIALVQRDRELARRVLAENPALETDAEGPSELLRLATGVSESAAVVEKTIGLVLNVRTAVARRRSSQLAAGLTQSLSLVDTEVKRNDRGRIDVVLSDDANGLERGLAELAARGAPLLLTGATEDDATTAARFAARERIPVVLFLPPRVTTNYAFVLGIGDAEQERLAGGGLDPDAALATELECEVAAESTAATGFPMAKWGAEGRKSLYLLGDAACAQRALSELRTSTFHPDVWFGLESGHLWPGESNPDFHALRAGRFPWTAGALADASALALRLHHQPTWYETLGHDAALIVKYVLEGLPQVHLQDDEQVALYHARVLQRLKTFESDELWSSTMARFDDTMRLERFLAWQ